MAPFSVIVFGVVVWTIALSGAKQLRFRLKTDWCGRGLIFSTTFALRAKRAHLKSSSKELMLFTIHMTRDD